MSTPLTALPTGDDDDSQAIRKRSSRSLQPIGPQTSASSRDDELAELAKRTSELAERAARLETAKDSGTTILNADQKHDNSALTYLEVSNASVTTAKENKNSTNPAVEMIRGKLRAIYGTEPSAKEEILEIKNQHVVHSPHQAFMQKLTTSGKSLAQIQTDWHNYYVNLPDNEKHQVWQEFYRMQHATSHYASRTNASPPDNHHTNHPKQSDYSAKTKSQDNRSVSEVKKQLLQKVGMGTKLSKKQHVHSLLFGLGLAMVTGALVLFTFFNEVFIAPFISPSRSVSATPIIGNDEAAIGPEPKILIPKINLEVPVVYDTASNAEEDVQKALEDGVVHYVGTPKPGQTGNVVIVGHSSNNILNKGKYKFAFVLLKRLETDDTIIMHKDSKRYTYKVIEKKIVEPTDISVLQASSKPNTITLITCDPPGTSLKRLVVVAEQITPDPSTNSTGPTEPITNSSEELPSNAPSLWSKITGWIF